MARDFGAAASYFRLADGNPYALTTAWTIQTWVNFDSITNSAGIFIHQTSNSQVPVVMAIANGGSEGAAGRLYSGFFTLANNWRDAQTPANPRLKVWLHYVGRWNGTNMDLFENGKLIARDSTGSGSPVAPTSGDDFLLGRWHNTDTHPDGRMEHMAVWNQALTNNEILALSKGVTPDKIRYSALKGYWPLSGTYGSAVDLGPLAVPAPMTGTVLPAMDYVQGTFEAQDIAAEIQEGIIETPYGQIQLLGYEPTPVGPEELDAPFATIDVEPHTPGAAGSIEPPFFTVGFHAGPVQPGSSPSVDVDPVEIVEGALPPYVPPSLPPTIPPGTPEGPGVPLPPLSSGGLAGIRFYQGPPWRWVVTDLDTNTITFLDHLALDATVTYGLNRGASAKISMPSANPEVNILHTDGEPFVSEGNRLLYGFRREGGAPIWKVRFAGKILQVEDHGELENARTVVTAYDPWHLLYQRPMINVDGEFPDEAGFFSFDDTQVGVICRIFLNNTIINNGSGLNDHGDLGIDMGDGPLSDLEPAYGDLPGTPYWDGEYENTTAYDTFSQQGMMVGEVWDQQLENGNLDIVMTPIYDPVNRPGYMVDLSIFEIAGSQRDDAVFAWDKPSRNLIGINSLKDGTKRANTIRYYYGEGGPPSGGGIPLSYGPSITKYGETWHQQFYPGRIEEVVNALATLQLFLMEDGIKTVHVTPTPERMPFLFTEFWLGDTVPVYASSNLRQTIAGYQRIYGVVLSIDENSYEQVPQLLVSPSDA
jgi:hypothetical protein